jgi:hypothetical protein
MCALSLSNFSLTLLKEYHQPSSAKLTQMSTESEALSTTNIKTATNIEVDLITDMLDWIKNSPQSIYRKKLLCAFKSSK